jgi:hypothetical protein
MKSLALILVGIFAFGLVLSTSTPARAESYPFTCKIGTMNRPIKFNDVFSGLADVSFSSSIGAVAAGLQPGQCAFSDRAVRPSEPHTLCFAVTLGGVTINQGAVISEAQTSGPGQHLLLAALFGPTTLMNFTVHAAGTCLSVDSYGV